MSASSLPDRTRHHTHLNVLIAATGHRETSWAEALAVRLSKNRSIRMRAVLDNAGARISQTVAVVDNRGGVGPFHDELALNSTPRDWTEPFRENDGVAAELVQWADLMVLAPLDADGIAKMLAGITDNSVILEILRAWDPSKKIFLAPGMTNRCWNNPMTRRHLDLIAGQWPWVRVVSPILWHYDKSVRRVRSWEAFNEVVNIIRTHADLIAMGVDVNNVYMGNLVSMAPGRTMQRLPPELWSMILEHTRDWELAQALGVHTNLPVPPCWSTRDVPAEVDDPLKIYERELEWTVLKADTKAICKKLSEAPPRLQSLSSLAVKLIIRFSLVDVLAYLEEKKPVLFRSGFDDAIIPHTASTYYPQTPVLNYWRDSPWFRSHRIYAEETMDGASGNGHISALDWWRRDSGLPLKYSEAALERASGNGHLLVLEWWRDAAAEDKRVVPRPGRSVQYATQNGRVEVLRWWHNSGIPASIQENVCTIASRWGHVAVLELTRQLVGDDKVSPEEEALIQATTHQHVEVLEWWKQYAHGTLPGMHGRGFKVEYRTCNIEEALEDSMGGNKDGVGQWWVENGLNLGLRNMEWMLMRAL